MHNGGRWDTIGLGHKGAASIEVSFTVCVC